MRGSLLSAAIWVLLVPAPLVAGEPRSATLDVPGMYCSLCSVTVRKALERVPGVIDAKADNSSKRAEVRYDPEKTSAEQVAAALGKAGYPATVRRP